MQQKKLEEEEEKLMESYDEVMERAILLSDPKMLFSSFWRRYQLCILFGKTSTAKSPLAMQIAWSLSKGIAIDGFALEVPAQKVLFFNYEVEEASMKAWYANKKEFERNPNFQFAHINKYNPDIEEVINRIKKSKIKIIIIDNLTRITGFDIRKSISFVNRLHELKDRLGLSILLITHMPKSVKQDKPITEDNAWGSALLMNRCSTSFAIVQSDMEPNWRYLKQTKAGPFVNEYTQDSVALCEVLKTDRLQLKFLRKEEEELHLVKKPKERKEEKEDKEIKIYNALPEKFTFIDGLTKARKYMSERTFRNWLNNDERFQKVGDNWQKVKVPQHDEDGDDENPLYSV